jgi:hypothetical protein
MRNGVGYQWHGLGYQWHGLGYQWHGGVAISVVPLALSGVNALFTVAGRWHVGCSMAAHEAR